jgi:hypothetical protein
MNTTIAVRTGGRWLFAASQNTTHRWFFEKLMDKFDSRTVPSPHCRPMKFEVRVERFFDGADPGLIDVADRNAAGYPSRRCVARSSTCRRLRPL